MLLLFEKKNIHYINLIYIRQISNSLICIKLTIRVYNSEHINMTFLISWHEYNFILLTLQTINEKQF